MSLQTRAESGVLHAEATGTFSLAEAKRTFLEMLEAVALNNVKRVLLDGRGLTGEPAPIERFYYGKFAAESVRKFADRGVPAGTLFAYVLVKPMLDRGRFGEVVAANRGMSVKTFDNLEEALRWIGIEPSNGLQTGDSQ